MGQELEKESSTHFVSASLDQLAFLIDSQAHAGALVDPQVTSREQWVALLSTS